MGENTLSMEKRGDGQIGIEEGGFMGGWWNRQGHVNR